MTKEQMISELEDILDVEEGTLEENTELASLDEWDSVAKLSLVIFMDEECGKKVSGDEVAKLKTVKDIMDLCQ